MSENETHKGRLVPMVLNGVTIEERAKAACEWFNIEPTGCHDSWMECLRDRGYKKVYIRNEIIYEIKNTELDPYGFSEVEKHKDGTIDYFMSYYNGGGSFDEVLDSALDRMEKNKDD